MTDELLQTMDGFLLKNAWLRVHLFSNAIADYLGALILFSAVWLILSLIQKILCKKLSYLEALRSNQALALGQKLVSEIRWYTLPIIAFVLATRQLHWNPKLDDWLTKFIQAILTFQVLTLLTSFVRHTIDHFKFSKQPDDLALRSAKANVRVVANVTVWIAGILFYLSNIGLDVSTFITGLGIGGVAIALAAQNILGDAFSSFTIAVDKPFEIGDFIVVDGLRGKVEHIGLKTTRIRSMNGEILIFSNSDLTKARIQNYKLMESRRIQFSVKVSHQNDVVTLKSIPDMIAGVIKSTPKTRFERAHLLRFDSSSLEFEIAYHVASREYIEYCNVQQEINQKIIEEFRGRGIQIV